jgi:hypothetical protein
MSSGQENKMYNFEVPPPVGLWEKIAAELDESAISQQFPSRLYSSMAIPPPHIWNSIANNLDESIFVNDYADKLANIEITPPATVWNKIKTSLNTGHEAITPVRRSISPFIKYAAAAAILGFIAWGGIKLFNSDTRNSVVLNEKPKNGVNAETVSPITNEITADENTETSEIALLKEEIRNDAALEASKKTFAKLDVAVTQSKIKKAADFFFVSDDYDYTPSGTPRGFDVNTTAILPDPAVNNTNKANRYIVLMTPDGNIIRMSKKFRDIVCCISGEEIDKDCTDQLKKWREKIANPSNTHSSGNFMEILSLLDAMQEN